MQIRMLREIDRMFDGAPQTRKTLEAKEEMLQNLMEKFSDLTAQGKSEEAAFNIAIASVGDISDLLEELNGPAPEVARFDDEADYARDTSAGERAAFSPHDRALVVSVSVMMYILSPVALILFRGRVGTLLMLVLMALATGMLVYNGMTRPKSTQQAQESVATAVPMSDSGEEAAPGKRSKKQKRFMASMSGALWMITVALYFVISFATGAWHISWIIFLIAAAAGQVLRAFIDLYWG